MPVRVRRDGELYLGFRLRIEAAAVFDTRSVVSVLSKDVVVSESDSSSHSEEDVDDSEQDESSIIRGTEESSLPQSSLDDAKPNSFDENERTAGAAMLFQLGTVAGFAAMKVGQEIAIL